MNILHINTFNQYGGAETVAYSLFKSNSANSFLVKETSKAEAGIYEFPNDNSDRFFSFLNKLVWKSGFHRSFKKVFFLEEEFNHTYRKLSQLEIYKDADIIHLHNIHGGYFDLTALKQIAREKKIVWTLHDMWSMTGGEAHVFENNNYQKGIGKTPYKNIPPLSGPVIDRRQHYIKLKKDLYQSIAANTYFVPVSKWLEMCFISSYVYNETLHVKMIYSGFDETVFYPTARKESSHPKILIFPSQNPFKGASVFEEVLAQIKTPFELYVVGEHITIENPNLLKTTIFPFIKERKELAKLYNAVDILIFPSKAESFGLVPLEAMACGVCVFASNIGGLPELIEHQKTGFLFNDSNELISLLKQTLINQDKISETGRNASVDVKNRFPIDNMINEYNDLYWTLMNEII